MLLAVAVVIGGIGVYARADFGTPTGTPEQRAPVDLLASFTGGVGGSLNLVFVSGDLFTLYVALELLTFSGVPLVCLDGRGETLRAALRYLLFALAGRRFTCLAPCCSTVPMARSTSRCWPGASNQSPSRGPPPR